jgi:hypothetical protein
MSSTDRLFALSDEALLHLLRAVLAHAVERGLDVEPAIKTARDGVQIMAVIREAHIARPEAGATS